MMFRVINSFSISSSAKLVFQFGAVCGLTFLLAGCDKGPPARFQYQKTTEDLIPDAKKAVLQTLKDGFGTPNEIVAWERFPIAYGGGKGTIDAVEEKSVKAKFEGEAAKISDGAPVVWISGSRAGTKSAEDTVNSYKADTQLISFKGGMDGIAAGDRFIVGYGENISLGRHIYMRNCMHCHGVTGDGAGPTAEFLNPRPRDYRNGEFKFTSTKKSERASRDDLHRIVQYGIPGTYMPSFLLLGDKETKSVVEYVRWLAIRGEFERRIVGELTNDYSETAIADTLKKAEAAYAEKKKNKEEAEKPPTLKKAQKATAEEFKKYAQEDFPAAIEETANLLAEAWTHADEADTIALPSTPRVEDTAESRERGRILYMSEGLKCYTCHGVKGLGDGSSTDDFWKDPFTNIPYPKRGLHDIWGNPLKPRNLTIGQYRGGRRPIDIFRRLYVGIKGTPMPAFGGGKVSDDQLWDVVNYVMSLPYASRQQPSEHAKENVAKREESPAN